MKPLPRPVIRAATRADLEKFYRTKTIQQTIAAKVAIVRGRMLACWGRAYVDGRVYVFFDLKPAARRYKVTMVKAGMDLIAEARADGCRVMYVERDPAEPGAERWLKRLGFMPTLKPGVFRWHQM